MDKSIHELLSKTEALALKGSKGNAALLLFLHSSTDNNDFRHFDGIADETLIAIAGMFDELSKKNLAAWENRSFIFDRVSQLSGGRADERLVFCAEELNTILHTCSGVARSLGRYHSDDLFKHMNRSGKLNRWDAGNIVRFISVMEHASKDSIPSDISETTNSLLDYRRYDKFANKKIDFAKSPVLSCEGVERTWKDPFLIIQTGFSHELKHSLSIMRKIPEKDAMGWSLLHHAAYRAGTNGTEMVSMLLSAGHIQTPNRIGRLPLEIAKDRGNEESYSLLESAHLKRRMDKAQDVTGRNARAI